MCSNDIVIIKKDVTSVGVYGLQKKFPTIFGSLCKPATTRTPCSASHLES